VTSDVVQIWLIRSDVPATLLADLAKVLDEDEQRRARLLLADRDRCRFTAAHGAVRVILGDHLGVPPGQVRWTHGPHGKPELAGACAGTQVSLSHSAGLAALAVTRRRRVGVDLQRLEENIDPGHMATRYYPAAEARFVASASGRAAQLSRFVRLWARKEACVKVPGGHLMQGMMLPTRGRSPLIVSDPDGALPGPYLVRDVRAPPGFRAAVAVEGTLPYRVTRHWWPGDAAGVSGDQAGRSGQEAASSRSRSG
jgi:4'-phosphopantetheinyl transferase